MFQHHSFEHHSSIIRASFEHHSSIIQVSFEHHSSIIPASFQHHSSIIPASFQHHSSIIPASFQHHSSIIRASFQHHSSIIQASFQHHSSIIRASFEHHSSISRKLRITEPQTTFTDDAYKTKKVYWRRNNATPGSKRWKNAEINLKDVHMNVGINIRRIWQDVTDVDDATTKYFEQDYVSKIKQNEWIELITQNEWIEPEETSVAGESIIMIAGIILRNGKQNGMMRQHHGGIYWQQDECQV